MQLHTSPYNEVKEKLYQIVFFYVGTSFGRQVQDI